MRRTITKLEILAEIKKERNPKKIKDLYKILKLKERYTLGRPIRKSISQLRRNLKKSKRVSEEFKAKVKYFELKSYGRNGKKAFVIAVPKGTKLPRAVKR